MKIVAKLLLGTVFSLGMSLGPASAGDEQKLHDAFPASIREAGVLRVAINYPRVPFVMKENPEAPSYSGIDIDLANLIGEKAGLKIEFTNTSFQGLVPAMQAGQADLIWSGMLATKEREEVADFVLYLRSPIGLLVPKGNPLHIQSIADLCGKKLSIREGSPAMKSMVEERQAICADQKKMPIEVVPHPQNATSILAVKSGSVDAWVTSAIDTAFVASTEEGKASFEYAIDRTGWAGEVYMYDGVMIPKGNAELLNAIQQAVQAAMDDGSYMKVLEKYGQPKEFSLSKAVINTPEN